jgi:glycine reductase
MLYYGDNFVHALPIFIHPNEILDGAVLNRDYLQMPNADPTFLYQNHPMLLELYRRHNIDINWVGTVMYNAPHEVKDKKRNAMKIAQYSKEMLNADIAILTKEGGGHPQIDLALSCVLCEENAIKTAMLISEFQSEENVMEEGLLFTASKADAIVTPGCLFNYQAPAVDRVIGKCVWKNPIGNDQVDFSKEFMGQNRYIRGALSQLGGSWYSSKAF